MDTCCLIQCLDELEKRRFNLDASQPMYGVNELLAYKQLTTLKLLLYRQTK
jgi:hypothetical protein